MEEALQIRWRYDSEDPDSECDQSQQLQGWSYEEEVNGVYSADLVMCNVIFAPPSRNSLEEELTNGCNLIADRATPTLDIPAATIMHELLHWKELNVKNGLDYIDDWNHGRLPNIDPSDGYGAYNAKRVDNSFDLVQEMLTIQLNDLNKKPRLNANSYVYFTLESFFLRHYENLIDDHGNRRGSFEDPIEADWVDANVPS